MKYSKLIIGVLLVILLPVQTVLSDSFESDEIEAQTVLKRYFGALAQGDVVTLRSLVGGNLLEKRERLFDNPTYPTHLVSTYQQADFQIVRVAKTGDDTFTVDARIAFSPDEVIETRFLLTREIRPDTGQSRFFIQKLIYND